MSPQRIQLRRTKGWTKPTGAIVVARPTRWGNPVLVSDVGEQFPSLDDNQVAVMVVRTFEPLARNGRLAFPNWRSFDGTRGPVSWTYPSVAEIREHLAGHDLACWCPPDRACHADVLLEIANGAER